MNKKGIIALVVVVILIVIGFVVSGNKAPAPATNTENTTPVVDNTPKTDVPAGVTKDTYKPVTKDTTDTTLIGRLNNASVGISEDGKKIGFVNGTATFTSEGSSAQTVGKVGAVAIEKIVGSRKDVLSTVSLTTSGTTATYLVLFLDNGGASAGLDDKSYAQVGTGITVTGIRADSVADKNIDYVVSVSYTDSKKAAHSKLFVVAGGAIDLARTIEL